MPQLVVSLTSIPPRFKHLPAVIRSIAEQSVTPDRIELYVPRQYRREEFNTAEAPVLPDLPDTCEVVVVDTDYGPASKILHAAKRYRGTDTLLVYCDDDKTYHPKWLEALVETARAHPDACIANSAQPAQRFVDKARWMNKGWDYRLLRLLSLGRWKPIRSRRHYRLDIAEGCNGVLIRPDFVEDTAYDIPDILWTVDDVWLSGMYQKRHKDLVLTGVDQSILDAEIFDQGEKVGRQHSLVEMVYKGHDRIQANAACVRYMRDHFGVFPKAPAR